MHQGRPTLLVLFCFAGLLLTQAAFAATPSPYIQVAAYTAGLAGEAPVDMAVADLNADGRDDVVALTVPLSFTGNTPPPSHLAILLGQPDGTLVSKATYAVPTGAAQLLLKDLNGDGKLDIVVMTGSFCCIGNSDTISVLLGNGDGTFAQPVTTSLPGQTTAALAIADLNGDGKLDLVTLVSSFNAQTQSIVALLGNGNGTFQPATVTNMQLNTGPEDFFALGDFDGDGHPDIVGFGNSAFDTFFGNGDGTFRAPAQHQQENFSTSFSGFCVFTSGSGPFYAQVPPPIVGDFNGDGKLDILFGTANVGMIGSQSVPAVIEGNGDGSFQPPIPSTTAGITIPLVTACNQVAADLDNDGKLDSVTYGFSQGGGQFTQTATFQTNYQAASLDQPVSFVAGHDSTNFTTQKIFAANLSGTGRRDLVMGANANAVRVMINDSNGNFEAQQTYPSGNAPGAIAVGDFNNDGLQDQIIANRSSNNLTLLLSRGNGTFREFTLAAGTNPQGVAVGDFNNDGKLDFAVTNGNDNTVGVYLGNGAGGFAAPVTYVVGGDPRSIAVEDFNQDGKLDLVTVNRLSNTTSVLLGNGDGTFQTAVTFSITPGPIVNTASPEELSSAPRNTCGTAVLGCGPSSRTTANVGPSPEPNSGKAAASAPSQPGESTYQGTASAVPPAASNMPGFGPGDGSKNEQLSKSANQQIAAASLSSPREVTVADLNGDGFPDLVVVNEGSNSVSVLLNDGTAHFPTTTTYLVGTAPLSVAIGDLNGDGKADIMVANSGSNNMSVLIGKGDGTFTAGTTFSAGASTTPAWITLLSSRNNGKLDAVVANSGTNALSVFFGNGDGTFQQPPVSYSVGLQPQYSHAGNFTGGGSFDLAASSNLSNTINVLLNGGVAVAQLVGSSGTTTFGQPVTFTATIKPTSSGSPTPTGSVTFTDSGATLGSVALNASGVAAFTTSTLTGGVHTIAANYSGDSRYFANSTSVSHTVTPATPTVNVASTLNPSIYGQNVTFNISVTSAAGMPSGNVKITDGAAVIATPALSSGAASFLTAALTAGAHNLQFAYLGDPNFTPASTNLVQTVNPAASSAQVSSSLNPSAVGQSVTFTAHVVDATPASVGNPTGSVTFSDGAASLGSATLDPSTGLASLAVSSLIFGPHSITAAYSGDANFAASTSPAITQTVLHATSTAVTSPGAITFGQQVTFTATVTSSDGGTATGTVTFFDGATMLGAGALNGSAQAAFTTAANQPLAAGSHSITAVYAGDSNFVPSTSPAFNQTVNSVTGFSVSSLTHAPLPIVHIGQQGTFTATLKNQSGAAVNNIEFSLSISGGRGYFVSGSFSISSGGTGTCNVTSQPIVTCAIGTMNDGDTATVTITGVPTLAHTLLATGSANATTQTQPDTVEVRFKPFKQ